MSARRTGRCGRCWSGCCGMSEVEDPGVELLTDAELAAVVRVVRAFVDHDEVVLRDVGAYAHGDRTRRRVTGGCGTTSTW
jgi:hypothetical protein